MEDKLIIAYDNCSPDVPTLMVARQGKYDMTILKKIQGNEALKIYRYLTSASTRQKKKRKYYRKCGICGDRYEQSKMIRTNSSPNGWLCWNCHDIAHPEYDD